MLATAQLELGTFDVCILQLHLLLFTPWMTASTSFGSRCRYTLLNGILLHMGMYRSVHFCL